MSSQEPNEEERLAWVRPIALPGTEILVAYSNSRLWHVFHERYVLCACRTAAADWRYRGQTNFLTDRSVMLMEPGETHRNLVVNKPSDFKALFVDPNLVENAAKEFGLCGTPHFQFPQVDDPRLFAAVYIFCASVEAADNMLEQQSWLTACVRFMLEYAERRPLPLAAMNGLRAVERAKDYLRARFNEAVSLDELEAVTGLSRFHLVRLFTKHVGIPPHAYQTHVRIEQARALLQAGTRPASAALSVGFADQSHFTRHFKRILRITPGDYVRATT